VLLFSGVFRRAEPDFAAFVVLSLQSSVGAEPAILSTF